MVVHNLLIIVTLMILEFSNDNVDMIWMLCWYHMIVNDHLGWLETRNGKNDPLLWNLLKEETLVNWNLHMVVTWWLE